MGWSDLPAELVAAIADRITEHADLARFRSVCPSWRSASAAHAARRRVPLLLVPGQYYSSVNRGLLSLTDDRIVKIPMPAARGCSFLFASTHGWMLGVAGDFSATLAHPFTGASAILPALPSPFRDNDEKILRDMVWDWSPHAVMVSPSKGAFFCRPGDGAWSPAGCSQLAAISSITYCDGAFYLFDGGTRKTTVLDAANFAVVDVIKPPALKMPNRWCQSESTRVVSSAELLLIVRTRLLHPVGFDGFGKGELFKAFRAERRNRPPIWSEVTSPIVRTRLLHPGGFNGFGKLFKAFRAERRNRPPIWSEVADIGDRAVFVDHFRGFCVEANGLNGVRRNCMYVASSYVEVNDDFRMDVEGKYTVSVLDFADQSTECLWYGNLINYWCSRFWQWPSWSMPNLH